MPEGFWGAGAEHAHAPVAEHKAVGEVQWQHQRPVEAGAMVGWLQGAGHGLWLENLLIAIAAVVQEHLEKAAGFFCGGIQVACRYGGFLETVVVGHFHNFIDTAAHRVAEEQVHQFQGEPGGYIDGPFGAGVSEGEILHSHGLANDPVEGGVQRFSGYRFHHGAKNKAGGYRVVGLGIESAGLGGAEDVDNFLGPIENVGFHRFLRAGNPGLMGKQVAQRGAALAVLSVSGQVAGHGVVQIKLTLFHQMMYQHGADHFGSREQAYGGVRRHDALGGRVGVADAAV